MLKIQLQLNRVGKDVATEFKRKIRFSATNFQTMVLCINGLLKRGLLISYAFFSHKISRWFLPFNLILLYIINLFLFDYNSLINISLLMQSMFYILALLGSLLSKLKSDFFCFHFHIFLLWQILLLY